MASNEAAGVSGVLGGDQNSDDPRNSSGGGPRGNNPWGKRPTQGPPDLDQWVRNLQRKLSGFFGRNNNNGTGRGSDGGGSASGIGLGVVVAVLVAVWALTGFYQNAQAERTVILRFGKFLTITTPGLNWRLPWPIDRKYVVNIEHIDTYTDQTRMLTADENMVDINLAVQFRRVDPKPYIFNVRDPDATLREVSESAVREVIGRSTLGQVLESGRQEIEEQTKGLIQRTLDSYHTGISVTSANLQGVSVPEQVAPAQQDAIKAGKDKERFSLEAQTYANDLLPKARGAAAREVQDAQAYRAQKVADSEGETARFTQLLAEYEHAPAVTRQRLYLETIESVYSSAKKVIVDTKGSNNMLYVPIDKLIEQSRSNNKDTSRDSVVVTRAPNVVSESPQDDGRSRGER